MTGSVTIHRIHTTWPSGCAALDLMEAGIELMRQRIRREQPSDEVEFFRRIGESEVRALLIGRRALVDDRVR